MAERQRRKSDAARRANQVIRSRTLLLMLIFGFWFSTEVSCQIVYGDLDRVFHIEENIRKMKDAQLEAALEEDRAGAEEDQPR